MDWIHLTQDRDHWQAVVNVVRITTELHGGIQFKVC